MSLLEQTNYPADLKKLDQAALTKLAKELREFMLDTVSKKGGHLAPSLGAVELTLALHYCYNTPEDKLVWDVGHQAYAHKILTGRRNQFGTLRQYGGISGFPRIAESEYDTVSTGHASTSISVGLGIAMARDLQEKSFNVVSIIGDGSMSAGLAFEGLNNLGSSATNMTVVLNDNEMSISKNVGALSRYLTRIITDKRYNKLKSDVWELLGSLSNVGKKIRSLVHSVDDAIKHVITPGKLFEDMGLRYIGPIDGHNIKELIDVFNFAKQSTSGPILVHVLTKKGKGYSFAEVDATKFHGIGTFSRDTGKTPQKSPTCPSYSKVFGKSLAEIAEEDKQVVAITAAMPDGTGLDIFRDAHPDRFFDVGITEGHAVTFAAGLAIQGLKPVVAIYSTFLQRAYDNIIHDVALDEHSVIFCLDRAGLVGSDGPTHHGTFDLTYARVIPGATIMTPSSKLELRQMLYTAIKEIKGPVFIRYPRGSGHGNGLDHPFEAVPLYKPKVLQEGKQVAILVSGDLCYEATKCCELLQESKIKPTLVDVRFVKPLDKEFYQALFQKHKNIVTIESNSLCGGFGAAILELVSKLGIPNKVLTLGYPDKFIPHGDTNYLLKEIGLSAEGMAERIKTFIAR